eukprot:GHVT01035396.1.p1 GENE.GHVT01035396.1~~GHVT01035396.1.p1  ORF type:complete len:567 (-),score=116.68 GHVT01035396.1:1231-2931(-)
MWLGVSVSDFALVRGARSTHVCIGYRALLHRFIPLKFPGWYAAAHRPPLGMISRRYCFNLCTDISMASAVHIRLKTILEQLLKALAVAVAFSIAFKVFLFHLHTFLSSVFFFCLRLLLLQVIESLLRYVESALRQRDLRWCRFLRDRLLDFDRSVRAQTPATPPVPPQWPSHETAAAAAPTATLWPRAFRAAAGPAPPAEESAWAAAPAVAQPTQHAEQLAAEQGGAATTAAAAAANPLRRRPAHLSNSGAVDQHGATFAFAQSGAASPALSRTSAAEDETRPEEGRGGHASNEHAEGWCTAASARAVASAALQYVVAQIPSPLLDVLLQYFTLPPWLVAFLTPTAAADSQAEPLDTTTAGAAAAAAAHAPRVRGPAPVAQAEAALRTFRPGSIADAFRLLDQNSQLSAGTAPATDPAPEPDSPPGSSGCHAYTPVATPPRQLGDSEPENSEAGVRRPCNRPAWESAQAGRECAPDSAREWPAGNDGDVVQNESSDDVGYSNGEQRPVAAPGGLGDSLRSLVEGITAFRLATVVAAVVTCFRLLPPSTGLALVGWTSAASLRRRRR